MRTRATCSTHAHLLFHERCARVVRLHQPCRAAWQAQRYMISIRASNVAPVNGAACVAFRYHGQSFLLHQVIHAPRPDLVDQLRRPSASSPPLHLPLAPSVSRRCSPSLAVSSPLLTVPYADASLPRDPPQHPSCQLRVPALPHVTQNAAAFRYAR